MKKISVYLFVIGFSILFGAALPAQTADRPSQNSPSASETFLIFEGMLDKALIGYNSGDFKTFFSDFSPKVAELTTEEDFKILFAGMYKKDFGNFKTKEILFDRTSHIYSSSKTAIIGFSGKFEKNDNVLISAVLSREEKDWKILNISFHPKDQEKDVSFKDGETKGS